MRARWHWLLLAALLLGEFLLFDRMTSKNHAWVYPRWNDQIQYLTEAYTGYEYLQQHGLRAGLWATLVKPSAQGMLYDPLAVLVFLVAGPSRSAALSLNLLAFLALQAAFVLVLRRLANSWGAAWLGVGLLLCLRTVVDTGPGSPIDFRLDWMAACAFGVTLAAGVLADGFRSRGWSAVFGLATGFTILLRFLTSTYFTGIYLLLLAWFLSALRHRERRAEALARLGHFGGAMLAAAAVALPVLWLNREWVYNYYWIGHFTGAESALRSPHFGLQRSVGFVAEKLAWYHLGGLFLAVWSGIVALPALLAGAAGRGRSEGEAAAGAHRLAPALGCTLLFLAVPFVILTLHSQKSELVVSIMVAPAALFGLLLAELAARRLDPAWRRLLLGSLATLAVAGGAWHFGRELSRPPHDARFIASARKVNALADHLFRASRAAGLATPRVAVDQVTDSLDGQIMRVICYERQKTWVPFIMTLPTGITEEKEGVLLGRLAESDFVFLTDRMEGEGNWPYDRQMHRLHPVLQAWCEARLRPVEHFELSGRQMTLYQRREIP